MDHLILKSEDFITTKWSGGTATQLFIYPSTADYQKRNFDFRISTAKVEIEKSNFTSLPGVSRKIMILDGEITIQHLNHYSKQLKKFDIDEFEGNWNTSAIGTCTDFNVMTKNQTKSEVSAFFVEENESVDIIVEDSWNWHFIYVYSGELNLRLGNEIFYIGLGNLFIIYDIEAIHLTGKSRSEVVLVKIEN